MMVAIPVFKSRISPVMDWCETIVFIDVQSGQQKQRQEIKVADLSPLERVDCLVTHGADVLLCGAISDFLLALIESSGIRVIQGIAGQISDVINAFTSDTLDQSCFTMPGCRRKRQGHGALHSRGRRGHRGGRQR